MRVVVVTEPFMTKKGMLTPGTVIEIPENLLAKLQGKVRPYSREELNAVLKEMTADLNRHKWPEGIFMNHPPDFSEIDRCFLAGDLPGLRRATEAFKAKALDLLHQHGEEVPLW